MIFKNIEELKEIIEKNEIKRVEKLIKPIKKLPLIKTKKRSVLMVSGHQVKHLNKIDELKADVIMLNLEDGVPKEKKEIARTMIALFLSHLEKFDKEFVIRVNALNEGGIEDIEFLKSFNFNAFRIPKVNSLKEVEKVFKITDKEIHLSIETKEAFFNMLNFKHPKVTTFYFGLYDLLDELKIPHDVIKRENPLIQKLFVDFSLNSRYLNVTPIGWTYQLYKDLEGFRKWCLFQKDLGYAGVGCITPAQVEIANEVFTTDLDFAKMIIERFENEGPFTIDGFFVDEPIYKNYLNILNFNN